MKLIQLNLCFGKKTLAACDWVEGNWRLLSPARGDDEA